MSLCSQHNNNMYHDSQYKLNTAHIVKALMADSKINAMTDTLVIIWNYFV